MRLAVKKLHVEDAAQLQTLVVENLDGIEPGLAVLDARLLLGHSTIDVVAMDAAGTLVLVAVGLTANEEMILKAVEAYSWSLEYPQALQRLYPGCVLSEERPPRLLFVVERMPDAFQRKIKQLGFPEVDCVEVRHLEVDGVATVYFESLSRIRRLAPPMMEHAPQATVPAPEPTRGPAGENVIAMNGNSAARSVAARTSKPAPTEASLNGSRASERATSARDSGSVVSMINRQAAAVAPEMPRPVVEPVALRQPEPVAPAPVLSIAESSTPEPVVAKTPLLDPVVSEPVAIKPLEVEVSAPEPVVAKPLVAETTVAEAARSKEIVIKKVASEPVMVKPLAVESSTIEPAAKPSVASAPAVVEAPAPAVEAPMVKPAVAEVKPAPAPVIAPVAPRPATTTRTIAPAAPAPAPAPLPPLAKPVATSVPSLGVRPQPVTPRSIGDTPRPSTDSVAKPAGEATGERVSFKDLAQALLGAKNGEPRAEATAENVTAPSVTEPVATEPKVTAAAAPAAPALTVESLAAKAAPASPTEQAMVADTAKQIMSALPQEFEGLSFPNDGVLTRQWMDFLNQMSTTK